MHKKPSLAVAVCVTALAGLSAAPALAGEVQGPPGAANQPGDPTGIRGHANSICAFNGLNDFTQGQEDFQVQNFGVGVAGLTPNEPQDPHVFNPGDPTDGCRGGLLH
jgi:hypothetical protein